MKDSYTIDEIEALNTAIDAANGMLAKLWTGRGPRYFVAYIELGQQELKEDRLVINPHDYLSDSREKP